jgi:hypothetical protein
VNRFSPTEPEWFVAGAARQYWFSVSEALQFTKPPILGARLGLRASGFFCSNQELREGHNA